LALIEKEDIALEELAPTIIQQLDSQPLAWTLALCGEAAKAQSLSDDLAQKFPLDTIYKSVWLPLIAATLELRRGSAAGTGQSYSTAATGPTVRSRHLLQAGLDARTGSVTGEEWGARGGGVSKNHRSSRLGCTLTALAAGAPRTGAGGGVAGRCGEEPPGL